MATTSIGDALFTKTQQKVLGLLYGTPDKSFYTNEIFRNTNIGRGTVSRELEKLVSAGLVRLTRSGNQRHYQANPANPVYNELLSIIRKSFGIAEIVHMALEPMEQHIDQAFIYGPWAKNADDKDSDLDLMLIGEQIDYGDLMDLIVPLEESLGCMINPNIMSLDEIKNKLAQGNRTLERIMKEPVIMVIGVQDESE